MPFNGTIYRVMIASPSDLGEERQAVTEAMNEWNAVNAAAEGIVLLPVKWETHATPRAGIRPQEAIKKPALLYFSNRPIDPDKIDMKQHKKLKEFKQKSYRTALVGN